MGKNFLIFLLVLLFGAVVYFWGRKNGSDNVISTVTQNVSLVEQIAELSALSVHGNTNAKITNNTGTGGMWDKFKNYLAENTLQVTIPYEAKYGIDIKNKKIKADTKDKTITLYFPAVKLLSLQLHLDKMEMMNQTGLFNSTSIADLADAEKRIYAEAMKTLGGNEGYKKQAELQIDNILKNYYEPLGYTVKCIFSDEELSNQKQ